jgi:hypothetical protein
MLPKVKSIKPPPGPSAKWQQASFTATATDRSLAYVYFEEEPGAAFGGETVDAR